MLGFESLGELLWSAFVSLYIPIALFRFARMCRGYIRTGSLGDIDNTFFFSLIEWDKHTWGDRLKNFFFETHPASILMDGLFYFLFIVFNTLLISGMPWIYAAGLAIFVLVKVLQYLRNRHMMKEEFLARLKGEQ